jgi:hypothetical protein
MEVFKNYRFGHRRKNNRNKINVCLKPLFG